MQTSVRLASRWRRCSVAPDMKPTRVAALSLIAGLALADVAGSAYLWVLWQERHGQPADQQGRVRHGQITTLTSPQDRGSTSAQSQ